LKERVIGSSLGDTVSSSTVDEIDKKRKKKRVLLRRRATGAKGESFQVGCRNGEEYDGGGVAVVYFHSRPRRAGFARKGINS